MPRIDGHRSPMQRIRTQPTLVDSMEQESDTEIDVVGLDSPKRTCDEVDHPLSISKSECVKRRKKEGKGAILRVVGVRTKRSIQEELGAKYDDGGMPEWATGKRPVSYPYIDDARQAMRERNDCRGVIVAWDKRGQNGRKKFFTGPLESTYKLFCARGIPSEIQRCYYEVPLCESHSPRSVPVNAYADIDPSLPEGISPEEEKRARCAYLEKESRFLQHFRSYTAQQLHIPESHITESLTDSSRKGRISRHVVWHIKGVMFKDCQAVGAFMKSFELDFCQKAGACPAGDPSNEWYTRKPDGTPDYFVDNSVYNRAHNMRVIGSTKDGKPHMLRPAMAGAFPHDPVVLADDYAPTMDEVKAHCILYPPSERDVCDPPSSKKRRSTREGAHTGHLSSGVYIITAAMPHGKDAGKEDCSTNSLTDHWFDRDRWGKLGHRSRKTSTNERTLSMSMFGRLSENTLNDGTKKGRDLVTISHKEANRVASMFYLDVMSTLVEKLNQFGDECDQRGGQSGDFLRKKAWEWRERLVRQKSCVDKGAYISGIDLKYREEMKELEIRNDLKLCPTRAFSRIKKKGGQRVSSKEYSHTSENSSLYVRICNPCTEAEYLEVTTRCYSDGKHPELDHVEKRHAECAITWRRVPTHWESYNGMVELMKKFRASNISQTQLLRALLASLSFGGKLCTGEDE